MSQNHLVSLKFYFGKDGDEEKMLEEVCIQVGFGVRSHLYSVFGAQSLSFCSCCYSDSFVLGLNTRHLHSVSAL